MVTCSAEVMGSIPSSDGFFGFISEKKSCPSVVSCNTPVQRTVWGELWVSQLVSHTTSLLNILRVSGNSLNSLMTWGPPFFFFSFFSSIYTHIDHIHARMCIVRLDVFLHWLDQSINELYSHMHNGIRQTYRQHHIQVLPPPQTQG